VLETNKNKIGVGTFSPTTTYSGNGFATTELGNQVAFEYNQLYNPTNYWQTIKAGGYITNTQPITGMTGLTLTKSSVNASIKVSWSSTTTFSVDRQVTFDTSSPLVVTTNFNNYQPNYLKIEAIANSSIVSGKIEFSCSNSYPILSLNSNSTGLGTVSGAGTYAIGEEVTIVATPKTGAYFIGWFGGETLISSNASYTFNMPFADTAYSGHFAPNSYTMVASSESAAKGSVTGGGEYDYLESVTLIATPEMGYSFLGWYSGTTLVSSLATYSFSMPYNSLNYVAKFSTNNYTITLASEDTNKGTVSGAGTYPYMQSRSITATPQSGYSFVGWYEGETLISSDNPYTFTMPYNNLSYVAKFSTNSYALTLASIDINKGTVAGEGTFAYQSEVTVTATTIAGNEFIGWYEGATLRSTNPSYTFTMPYNALSLTAKFVTQYNVNISSFDETLGTVSGGGAHGYTTGVTITATPTTGNWFVAWYDDAFNAVSTNATYTFTMPEYDVTYYAEFSNVKPTMKGDAYTFGTYPQTKVTDSALITTLNAAGGTLPTSANSQSWTSYGYYISSSASTSYMWYIDITSGSNEYRGVYFTSYRPYSTITASSAANSFQDENGYTASSVYWFKYEPITWRVLDVQAGKAFLMANLVLDSQDYHYSTSTRNIGGSTVYSNNYQESHIRSWLNSNFYNTAFTTAEQARIQTTTVDNSVASTGYSSNPYVCANTSDKVFLLSYAEATSATYGLSTTTARQLAPSAYAKAQGVYTYTNGFNYWWLRSPDYGSDDDYARSVNLGGYVDNDYVNFTNGGVVPALWISL